MCFSLSLSHTHTYTHLEDLLLDEALEAVAYAADDRVEIVGERAQHTLRLELQEKALWRLDFASGPKLQVQVVKAKLNRTCVLMRASEGKLRAGE